MTTQYSTVQKLSLAGTVIGALMCVAGGIAPYWLVSDPEAPGSFSFVASVAGKVFKVQFGLFIYCEELLGKQECRLHQLGSTSGWFHTARLTGAGCILLAVLSGLLSLCLACCTCCKRIIAVGILAFLAAGAGAASAVIFSRNTDVFTTSLLGFKISSFGWAFYLFCAGVGVLGLVSFMACFSAPENRVHGMIFGQPVAPTTVVTTQNQQTCGYAPQAQVQPNAVLPPV